eukprot:Gregarina_sp_Poly_1__1741@NODE_1449_length_4125_cov_205_179892_g961_i0_p1_GENE_NODE_1449_length_4125_cov_205_179892_g961_i0NODE_1449_length_4125_cov_205_179892_g961_i0_p1_ORF_typecomplete_len710_score80_43Glyco_hydro_77/PF02446_17/4_9e60Glyco_hydro_77/PF02446_17/1_6e12_NODE_1449_length_4125_cov_205_179892_g961_i05322661
MPASNSLGLLVPLFSLPSVHDASTPHLKLDYCGDLGAPARRWLELLKAWHASDWLLLPLGPPRVDRWLGLARTLCLSVVPSASSSVITRISSIQDLWFDKCPYTPASAFALNSMFISAKDLIVDFPLPASLHLDLPDDQRVGGFGDGVRQSYANLMHSWLVKQRLLGAVFTNYFSEEFLGNAEFLWSFRSALQGTLSTTNGQAPDSKSFDCEPPDEKTNENIPTQCESLSQCESFNFKTCNDWIFELLVFLNSNGPTWLTQYAFFESFSDLMAIRELADIEFRHQPGFTQNWSQWPANFKHGDLKSLLEAWDNPDDFVTKCSVKEVSYQVDLMRSVAFHVFSQFIAHRQLLALRNFASERSINLIGDVPIYVPVQSSDCWGNWSVFSIDSKDLKPKFYGGTPPDFWCETGQLWETPTYDWSNMETSLWWERRLLGMETYYHKIRIDHFRAFADAWSVPREWAEQKRTGAGGAWAKGPGFAFFEWIRSRHPQCLPRENVIVEDLGEETPSLAELRSLMDFPRMVVFQFDIDDYARHQCGVASVADKCATAPSGTKSKPVTATSTTRTEKLIVPVTTECSSCTLSWIGGKPSYRLVAFTGTHDNPSLREWWSGDVDPEVRRCLESRVGRVAMHSERMPRFLLQWLFKMLPAATLLIVPVQDLLCLGQEARLNFPSLVLPNMWCWQMSLEQFHSISSGSFINWVTRLFAGSF